ncbi:FkbM family methyltransferase [Natranaeroarchaeum sulfidigenes]|uniref:SAM-dependent methyltransferase n=1 Tax=Natranaeroarchaeum sulfidigenes TaxID=2784880 RepID=A0A897MSR5_9EURY|nr:FkbM family methyltransferase [Natranaeroarchaeum sulfidigenes]QSG01265.1 SAM-dependent methyltransferase [Natranaeroarchaeum sulfidigenes]
MLSDGRLYTGHLKRITRRVGVHTHLKSLYWGLDIPRILFRLSRQDSIVHEVGGIDVELPLETYWQYQRFRWMHPEIRLFEELVEELEPGDVFYDVGAHLGWHAVVAASVHDEIDVVAFEPHPTTANRLRTVVETTGHDIDVHEVALHEKASSVEFTAAPSSAAHVSGAQGERLSDTITIETVDGDSLVASGTVPSPDVLKIDAEGVDAAVLRGLRTTIERDRPRVIYCEVHTDGEEIERLLDELGYEFEPLRDARPILKALPA